MSTQAWINSSFPSVFNGVHSFLMTLQLFRAARCGTQLGRWMWNETHGEERMYENACMPMALRHYGLKLVLLEGGANFTGEKEEKNQNVLKRNTLNCPGT